MNFEYLLTCICCALIVGLGAWLLGHTVDRRVHMEAKETISQEVFTARLQGLEDRLSGRMAAVKVKLDDLEKFTQHIDRRLEKLLNS